MVRPFPNFEVSGRRVRRQRRDLQRHEGRADGPWAIQRAPGPAVGRLACRSGDSGADTARVPDQRRRICRDVRGRPQRARDPRPEEVSVTRVWCSGSRKRLPVTRYGMFLRERQRARIARTLPARTRTGACARYWRDRPAATSRGGSAGARCDAAGRASAHLRERRRERRRRVSGAGCRPRSHDGRCSAAMRSRTSVDMPKLDAPSPAPVRGSKNSRMPARSTISNVRRASSVAMSARPCSRRPQ